MRGFEDVREKAEATLDDVLNKLSELTDAVVKLLDVMTPPTTTETVSETVEE